MKTQITPAPAFTSPFGALDKASIALKKVTLPTRATASLHKNRGDQDILVKWYFGSDDVRKFIPEGVHWDGMVDQESIEQEHAAFARAVGKSWKGAEDRIRKGARDTADWKVESGNTKPGTVSADGLWESLEEHGFNLLRARAYISRRRSDQRGVIELRFTHESVFQESLAALSAVVGMEKVQGTKPTGCLREELKKMMAFKMGFCTVFSNTATFDPTITINFRGQYNSRGERRTFYLREGLYGFC